VTGIKGRIAGATVGHGQEVGEGMTIPTGMENVGNLTTACVVFSGNHLLPPLTSSVNQGYDASHTYEESGYETYNQQSQGKPQDHAQDYDDRHQKGFQTKKRLVPSEPSPHVIFLGLDPDFSEADVCRRTLYIFEYRAESMLYFSCRHIYPTMDATLKQSPS
jgi:hypothetical protein